MCSVQSSSFGTANSLTAGQVSSVVAPVTIFLDIPLRVVFKVPDDEFQFKSDDVHSMRNSGTSSSRMSETALGHTSLLSTTTTTLSSYKRPRTANGRLPAAPSSTLNDQRTVSNAKSRPKTATGTGNACRKWLANTGVSDRTNVTSNCAVFSKGFYDADRRDDNDVIIIKDNPTKDKRFENDSNVDEEDEEADDDGLTASTAELFSVETMTSGSPTDDVMIDDNSRTCKLSFRSRSSHVTDDQFVDNDCIDDGVDLAMSSSGEDVFDFDDDDIDDYSLEPSGSAAPGGSAMDSVRMLVERLGLNVTSQGHDRHNVQSDIEAGDETTSTSGSCVIGRIIDDLAQLRAMDEALAGTLLTLCARLQQYKLQRHCLRHQNNLCDVMDAHSEHCRLVTHLLPYVDMTPDAGVRYGAPLRHYRLTRADLNEVGERRFTVL